MKKSDLRTGMSVTLRNGYSYYVMLNTGLGDKHENVLVHRVGDDIGWNSLANYDEDMCFCTDDDDFFPPTSEEDDREWDIMRIDACTQAAYLYCRKAYRTIWIREE